MVVTTGPMFSLDARGALGKSVIFSKGKKSHFAKKFHKPTNPRSNEQIRRRTMTKFLTQSWALMTDDQKSNFIELAKSWNISPYHAYLKFNSIRWNSFRAPATDFPDGDKPTLTTGDASVTRTGRLLNIYWYGQLFPGKPWSMICAFKPGATDVWKNSLMKLAVHIHEWNPVGIRKFYGSYLLDTDNQRYVQIKIGNNTGVFSDHLNLGWV